MSGSAPRRYQEGGRNRRPRRGDKRRLTREDLNSEIRKKEEELTKILEHRNEMKNDQRNQRNKMIHLYERKDDIRNQLSKLQKDISVKTDERNRSKASVLYLSVERHDEAIRRIEHQLRYNNFKLSEEKRLVTEIDSLKRSKRDLAKFKLVQSALDELKTKQGKLRDERKNIFAAIAECKKKEDNLKAEVRNLLADIEQRKKAIEELQSRVQAVPNPSSSGDELQPTEVDAEGRVINSEATSDSASVETSATTRSKECLIDAKDFEDANDGDASDSAREIENRKTLCRNLIIYLRALLPDWANSSEVSRPQPPTRLSLQPSTQSASPPSTPLEGAVAAAPASDTSSVAASKVSSISDTANLMSPSASSAAVSMLIGQHNRLTDEQIMRRRPGGYKLQRSARVLNHMPDVFRKFDQLGMQPPSGVAELPGCIHRLTALLDELEASQPIVISTVVIQEDSEKPEISVSNSERPAVGFERSLSNPSNGESGFSESSTTPLRPRSPELSRSVEDVPDSPSMTSITHDDLLSTSSTICSEDNGQSSSTDISPLAASMSST